MDLFLDCLKAFLVGGAICAAVQLLIDLTKLTPARILVFLVVSGVVLTAIGVYAPLVEFAGAGATVPLPASVTRLQSVCVVRSGSTA